MVTKLSNTESRPMSGLMLISHSLTLHQMMYGNCIDRVQFTAYDTST